MLLQGSVLFAQCAPHDDMKCFGPRKMFMSSGHWGCCHGTRVSPWRSPCVYSHWLRIWLSGVFGVYEFLWIRGRFWCGLVHRLFQPVGRRGLVQSQGDFWRKGAKFGTTTG